MQPNVFMMQMIDLITSIWAAAIVSCGTREYISANAIDKLTNKPAHSEYIGLTTGRYLTGHVLLICAKTRYNC